MEKEIEKETAPSKSKVPEGGDYVDRPVRLSDAVRKFDCKLGSQVRALEIQLEALKRQHCFCPDCRDKVRDEDCLRCQVQRIARKLRKYEPNTQVTCPDETPSL